MTNMAVATRVSTKHMRDRLDAFSQPQAEPDLRTALRLATRDFPALPWAW
jgi:hypothetical protein